MKYADDVLQAAQEIVAPHAGAWIEILDEMAKSLGFTSRAPRGRVD